MQASFAALPRKKRGANDGPTLIYSDIMDAEFVYNHPELGWRGSDDGSKLCGVGLYYDGLNCVNALGAFSGTHTLGLFYMQVYNLPQDQRQTMQNMQLVCIGYEDEIKYYGAEQVMCGRVRYADGRVVEEPWESGTSILSSLKRLDQGIKFKISKQGGGYEDVTLKAWLLPLSADFPAAAMCAGTKGAPSALAFCRCKPPQTPSLPNPTPPHHTPHRISFTMLWLSPVPPRP